MSPTYRPNSTETRHQDSTIATSTETYIPFRRAGFQGLVTENAAQAIEAALVDLTGCTPLDAGGRAKIHRFTAGASEGVVREYFRGGAMSRIIEKTYFMDNRPRREFEIHQFALEKNLPVPPLLGVAWKQIGIAYQGRIATGYIESAHLQDWLNRNAEPNPDTLRSVGQAIRRMHDAGIAHADLQVRNMLISETGPYLIDFDRAIKKTQLSPRLRLKNLLRLKRSFIKNSLPLAAFHEICSAYGCEEFPDWKERLFANDESPSS